MDLKEYEKCCWLYGKILCNPPADPNILLAATEAFHEAYALCLNAGHDILELKNVLNNILFTLNLESDDSDRVV